MTNQAFISQRHSAWPRFLIWKVLEIFLVYFVSKLLLDRGESVSRLKIHFDEFLTFGPNQVLPPSQFDQFQLDLSFFHSGFASPWLGGSACKGVQKYLPCHDVDAVLTFNLIFGLFTPKCCDVLRFYTSFSCLANFRAREYLKSLTRFIKNWESVTVSETSSIGSIFHEIYFVSSLSTAALISSHHWFETKKDCFCSESISNLFYFYSLRCWLDFFYILADGKKSFYLLWLNASVPHSMLICAIQKNDSW